MSERAPSPNPNERPTVEIPEVTGAPETGGNIDPTVTLDFDPSTEPDERAKILNQRLVADATLRGNTDMRGLELRIKDDEGGGRRYEVLDSYIEPVYEPKETIKRFSRPRIQGPLFKMPDNAERASRGKAGKLRPEFQGRHAFSRLKVESTRKQVGLPHLTKRGSSLEVTRKTELVDPVDRRFVTVNIYDDAGELITTQNQPLKEFLETAGGRLTSGGKTERQPQATWNWHNRTAGESAGPKKGRDLDIGLTRGGKPVFTDVTEQLERHGIHDWTGLTWQLEVPGRKTTEGSDVRKKNIGVKTVTQEIIQDKTVRERDYRGTGYHYVRRFMVKTTEEYEDGEKVVVTNKVLPKALKDTDLWRFLENPNDFPVRENSMIYNVRMPGVLAPTEEEEVRRQQESRRQLSDGLERGENRTLFVDSEGEATLGRRRPLSINEALGKLVLGTYPGVIDEKRIRAAARSGKERLGQELQLVSLEESEEYFDEAVRKVHATILPELEAAMSKLDLTSPIDDMDSWVAESLLARSIKEREEGSLHPFVAVLEEPHLLRNIIDEHIGDMFGHASIISKQIPVQVGVKKDGKPKFVLQTMHSFNTDLIEKLPLQPPEWGVNSYAATKTAKDRHDVIWGSIDKLTHKIYDSITDGKPVEYKDTQDLGRRLRRTIGE